MNRFMIRHMLNHTLRLKVRSALAILVAALTIIATGYITMVQQSFTEMLRSTDIKANLTGGVELVTLRHEHIANSGYAKLTYYEGISKQLDFMRSDVLFGTDSDGWDEAITFNITNDINRFSGENLHVQYAKGYDEVIIKQFGDSLVVGSELARANGFTLGDKVTVYDSAVFGLEMDRIIRDHMLSNPEDINEYPVLFAYFYYDIVNRIDHFTFTIAGIAYSLTKANSFRAYTPGSQTLDARPLFEPLNVVEYELTDNEKADEYRAYMEEIISVGTGNLKQGINYFHMDTSKLESIKNSRRLIDMLYPMSIVASLIVCAFICSLQLLQLSKEVAILRVLGLEKRKTMVMLLSEQIVLSVVGLIIGVCTLAFFSLGKQYNLVCQSAIFGSQYISFVFISGAISSMLVTRHSVLSLLQVRE